MALDPEAEIARRLQLQATFELILGTQNVYFQPPPNTQMQFPCIVYKRDSAETTFADNVPYGFDQRYQVMYISRDPDELPRMRIANLPRCVYVRHYTVKQLNHDVFTLTF